MKFALYARVSSDKQERERTIESQLWALRQHAAEQGYELEEQHVYVEEFPGDRLDRPQLDALRDGAREGQFDGVLLYCPDRLARRFAYQEIVLEELERYGCQVEFLERPISDNVEDRLLLQMQGVIAEYERRKILERTRRGRLHRAREGLIVSGNAPYGYHYVRRLDGVPAHFEVHEEEARVVRQIFDWLVGEQVSSSEIARRLRRSAWKTRRGGPWRNNTVGAILRNESYTGRYHYNKTRAAEPKRRKKAGGYVKNLKSSHPRRPREEWIEIPISRLIEDETFTRAQEQLRRNAALSFRNLRPPHQYLVRTLVRCGACGRARSGRTAYVGGKSYGYYSCTSRAVRPRLDPPCTSPAVRAGELDRLVWSEAEKLLRDPERILRYVQEQKGSTLRTRLDLTRHKLEELERARHRCVKQERRLVDAYEAEAIELPDLQERRSRIRRQKADLTLQIQQAEHALEQGQRTDSLRDGLTAFCHKIAGALKEITFEEKQRILQLLIEEISVHDGHVEIHYVVPVSGHLQLQPERLPVVSGQASGGLCGVGYWRDPPRGSSPAAGVDHP